MARPLPKDVEDRIAGTAKRAEVRSVAVWGFIAGVAVGFGLGAAFFRAAGSSYFFFAGAALVCALWWLAARRRTKTN